MARVRALANCYFNHRYQTPGDEFEYQGPRQQFLELVSGEWTPEAKAADPADAGAPKAVVVPADEQRGVVTKGKQTASK